MRDGWTERENECVSQSERERVCQKEKRLEYYMSKVEASEEE